MYSVWLTEFPTDHKHAFERIVRKQNRGFEHKEISGLLDRVASGEATCLRSFEMKETAENLVKEIQMQSGKAEIREPTEEG